ncbi:MAG: nucleotidyltransferase domain-containing protein [Clostridia bacterium]|nr:nucleotidyltransferase domain-containing protein [Clostridia bacterium]
MKFGLSNEDYESIRKIIEKYGEYKFKLFGSRARGNFKNSSDIDFAIFENISKEDEYKIRDDFYKLNIIYKIDLVFVNSNLKKELLDSILKEGVDF